jgi:hypothetical protein
MFLEHPKVTTLILFCFDDFVRMFDGLRYGWALC